MVSSGKGVLGSRVLVLVCLGVVFKLGLIKVMGVMVLPPKRLLSSQRSLAD